MESNNYKQWIGSIFDSSASAYGKENCSYFSYFAEELVNLVNPTSGTEILDVATGRGAILARAVQKIGPQGKAIGIDLSPQMVAETQRDLKDLSYVQVKQMDGEHLLFPNNSFDIVFCGFALFFMPNASQALREFKRVLKIDGVLALSTWGKRDYSLNLLRELAEQLGANPKIAPHDFQDPENLIKMLGESGFNDIEMSADVYEQVYPTIPAWWDSLWSHGTRGILEQLSELKQKELFNLMNEKLKPLLQPDGLHQKLHAFYTIAR